MPYKKFEFSLLKSCNFIKNYLYLTIFNSSSYLKIYKFCVLLVIKKCWYLFKFISILIIYLFINYINFFIIIINNCIFY